MIPSLSLTILIIPSLIVNKLSQAKAFFEAEIFNVPLFIVKVDFLPPFIPFFGLPLTSKVPVPLIINVELPLNFIPAPSKESSLSLSMFSLSEINDSPSNIRLTFAD